MSAGQSRPPRSKGSLVLAQPTPDQRVCSSRRPRQRETSSAYLIAFVLALGVVLPSVLTPASASAASRIRGCFQHSGQAVGGLYAIIEYWGAGEWRAAPGALSTTNVNGCVAFNISPGWRGTHMKIDAIGSDLSFRGSTGAPTLRFSELTVSGE